ncbi:hypothetical protein NC652_005564 [Populus alba x Populus x berolinensis]|nr:hypothetical protein NC652_005564 [Populus alba x Populus x berolinensis]
MNQDSQYSLSFSLLCSVHLLRQRETSPQEFCIRFKVFHFTAKSSVNIPHLRKNELGGLEIWTWLMKMTRDLISSFILFSSPLFLSFHIGFFKNKMTY